MDEEYNSVKTLSQTSVNGDVILKFITHDEDKQYIYIGITLKNGIESAFTYEKIVKQILKDLEMTSAVNVNLKGEINGELDIQEKNALADSLLGEVGAKISVGSSLYGAIAYNGEKWPEIMAGSVMKHFWGYVKQHETLEIGRASCRERV